MRSPSLEAVCGLAGRTTTWARRPGAWAMPGAWRGNGCDAGCPAVLSVRAVRPSLAHPRPEPRPEQVDGSPVLLDDDAGVESPASGKGRGPIRRPHAPSPAPDRGGYFRFDVGRAAGLAPSSVPSTTMTSAR